MDLSGLVFRAVTSDRNRNGVFECRWRGYRKYGFNSPESVVDQFDATARQYACIEENEGNVVGCLRMVSRCTTFLEIEQYLKIGKLIANGMVLAEVSRYSVPTSPRAVAVRMGLWKLAWLDAVANGHTHLLAWVRKGARRPYEAMGFTDPAGESLSFNHPLLGGHLHHVILLDLSKANQYPQNNPGLFGFFHEQRHANIVLAKEEGHAYR